MHEDVILDGTRLGGFERLVAHHEECAEPIELPTEGASATEDGTPCPRVPSHGES